MPSLCSEEDDLSTFASKLDYSYHSEDEYEEEDEQREEEDYATVQKKVIPSDKQKLGPHQQPPQNSPMDPMEFDSVSHRDNFKDEDVMEIKPARSVESIATFVCALPKQNNDEDDDVDENELTLGDISVVHCWTCR